MEETGRDRFRRQMDALTKEIDGMPSGFRRAFSAMQDMLYELFCEVNREPSRQ